MSKQRETLTIDEQEDGGIDVASLVKKQNKPITGIAQDSIIDNVARQSGFVSRSPRRTIKNRSPFTVQHNFKMRPGMKELFQEIGNRFGVYDHTTFEKAIKALLEQENMDDLIDNYNTLIDGN